MPDQNQAAPASGQSVTVAAGIGYGLAAALIWGSFIAFSRAGLARADLDSIDIAFLRAIVAGAVFLPWLLFNRARWSAELGFRRALFYALLVGPPFILIGVSGYYFAPLVHGAVLLPGTLTVMGVLIAFFVLNEEQAGTRLVSVAVIASGFALIAAPGLLSGDPRILIGDALFLCAGTMWAVFSIALRRNGTDPVLAVAGLSVLSMAIYCPLYLLFAGPSLFTEIPPATLAVQGLVQGLLTGVLAILFYSLSVRHLGAGAAAIFPALVPVTALLIGIPLTGEWLAAHEWAAVGLIAIGLLLSVRGMSRR